MLDKIVLVPMVSTKLLSESRWSTTNEEDFINGLGRGEYAPTFVASLGIETPVKKIEYRLKVLRGYESGLCWRHQWGKIDQVAIRSHIVTIIEKTKAGLTELSATSS